MVTPLNFQTRTQCPAGIDICVAGDLADCIWLLHEGEVCSCGAWTSDHSSHWQRMSSVLIAASGLN